MSHEEEHSAGSFISGLLLGVAVGAGLALLMAPQSGQRTRRQLRRSVEDLTDSAADRWDDVTGEVRDAVRTGKKKLDI